MMWWTGVDSWVGWLAMTLVMVGFWAVVVFAVWAIFRGEGTPRTEPRTAAQILEERYARGEIDANEFRLRQAALRGQV